MSKTKKLTPYQRIVRAAGRNKGVHLSVKEVANLSCDNAISHRAELDDLGRNGDLDD